MVFDELWFRSCRKRGFRGTERRGYFRSQWLEFEERFSITVGQLGKTLWAYALF